jgi:hypothetical protein
VTPIVQAEGQLPDLATDPQVLGHVLMAAAAILAIVGLVFFGDGYIAGAWVVSTLWAWTAAAGTVVTFLLTGPAEADVATRMATVYDGVALGLALVAGLAFLGRELSRPYRAQARTWDGLRDRHADVVIRDLTVANGRASGTTVTGPLGPATLGGGILNDQAHLTLSRVTLTNNQAVGELVGGGGGVANIFGATLTVESSTFADNRAAGASNNSPGGGILSDGSSALTVRHSAFTGNQAIDGGAIAVYGGSGATVSYSTFADNRARGNDGGPGLPGTPSSNGGAIFATASSVLPDSPAGSTTLTVSYSTFTGNEARGGDGGAGGPGVNGGGGGAGAAAPFAARDCG